MCSMLTGLFRDAVDSFAGLFDGFNYIFTGESTSIADKQFALDENPQYASYNKESWDPY